MPLTRFFQPFVVGATSFGIIALGTYFAVGLDPAVLTSSESEEVREELRAFRTVPLDEFVALNDGSPYRWVLGPGFAAPEADGTWVRAQRARIIFYLPENESPGSINYLLELSTSPLLADDQESRALTLRSRVDEVRMDLTPGGSRIFIELDGAEEQIVELICDSLDVPPDDQGTSDIRRLCVKVYAMAVRPAEVSR